MKIVIIVEGKTEKVFLPYLTSFLTDRLRGKMPRLEADIFDGLIPTRDKLKRVVLGRLKLDADYVIALTDVYTGSQPHDFIDATDAKKKMCSWVGEEPRFFPHVAQYDFEAWLLPYWDYIQRLARHNKTLPSKNFESINHGNPPSYRIREIFSIGKSPRHYNKVRDGRSILEKNGIDRAVHECAELRALVNTIITLAGGDKV